MSKPDYYIRGGVACTDAPGGRAAPRSAPGHRWRPAAPFRPSARPSFRFSRPSALPSFRPPV